MRFNVVTIFPNFFEGFLNNGIVRRACNNQKVQIVINDLRNYTQDKHRTVDDRPFGGSSGMVLKPEPIFHAVELITEEYQQYYENCSKVKLNQEKVAIVLLSPQGKKFSQTEADRLSNKQQIILICGRYEGVDERVAQYLATDEISIGDYILSGGEPAAIVMMDAIIRLLPGSMKNATSTKIESFVTGRLDYPVWTRPTNYRGYLVPEELLTGHHEKIDKWRRRKALEKTLKYRPDLLEDKNNLDQLDKDTLADLLK